MNLRWRVSWRGVWGPWASWRGPRPGATPRRSPAASQNRPWIKQKNIYNVVIIFVITWGVWRRALTRRCWGWCCRWRGRRWSWCWAGSWPAAAAASPPPPRSGCPGTPGCPRWPPEHATLNFIFILLWLFPHLRSNYSGPYEPLSLLVTYEVHLQIKTYKSNHEYWI